MGTERGSVETWNVFLCYRQVDGKETAEWLYQRLRDRRLPTAQEHQPRLTLYYDQTTPAVSNWQSIHRPALEILCLSSRLAAEVLYDTWEVSVTSPETFDAFVTQNQRRFDKVFVDQLSSIKRRLLVSAHRELESCEELSDVMARELCLEENPPANMYWWIESIERVVSREVNWIDTPRGSDIVLARTMFQMSELEAVFVAALESMRPQMQELFYVIMTSDACGNGS